MGHTISRTSGLRQERSKFSGEKRRQETYSAKRAHVAPFVRGQTISITISGIGPNGDGVAHDSGFTIFVPNTSVGQRVKAKVWRIQQSRVFTKRVEKGLLAPGRGEQKRIGRAGRAKKA